MKLGVARWTLVVLRHNMFIVCGVGRLHLRILKLD